MNPTGSIILTILERVRAIVDLTDTERHTNDYLVRHVLQPASLDVISRVMMTAGDPFIVRMPYTIPADTEYSRLPPGIGEVIRAAYTDPVTGLLSWEWTSKDEKHPWGPGWKLEGNCFVTRPTLKSSVTVDLWFVPNGLGTMHYATDGALTDGVTTTEATLSASPSIGMLDSMENAYVGSVYRELIPTKVWQESLITAYNVATKKATLRSPIKNAGSGAGAVSNVTYEVVPIHLTTNMLEAVAMAAALKLATWGKMSQSHLQAISMQYMQALKTVRDTRTNINSSNPTAFQPDTIYNPQYRQFR